MTRLEELSMNLADDLLTDQETLELQVLLAESEEAREEHIQILQIEAGLRASERNLDLAAPIMARLRSELADSVAQGVMSEIRAKPMPDWRRERASKAGSAGKVARVLPFPVAGRGNRWALKPALIALAACVVLVAGLGIWHFGPTMGKPVLAEVQGAWLSLERAGQLVPVSAGMPLQAGDLLRTSDNGTAAINFAPEKTRITLRAGTELKFVARSRGKRFTLRVGTLEASVARQRPFRPMLITTPQAEARVLGTKFTLAASTNGTELDVIEGKVQLTRTSDRAATNVIAGYYAIATNGAELVALHLTGRILREYWIGIGGQAVGDLTIHTNYPNKPSGRDFLNSFEEPTNLSVVYGTRIQGYLYPPKTGQYRFWIAAGNSAELYLSADDSPDNKDLIASVFFRSSPREWTRFPWQQSSPIKLEAGHGYYIEVMHSKSSGIGHLAVAWQTPGGKQEIIPGAYLAPLKTDR